MITGASGGLADSIINSFLKKGIEVIATSRSVEGVRKREWFQKVKYIPFDFASPSGNNLFEFFERPDAVVHLAWDKLKEYKSSVHEEEVLEQNKHFLTNLITNGLPKLVCAGTCYEYGLRAGCLGEEDEAAPVVSYAKGKNMLRIYLEDLRKTTPFYFNWVRIFNVFSPGREGSNLFSQLTKAIEEKQPVFNMSGGEQVRDYLKPEELADIFLRITRQNQVQGIINCCSGKPIKLKDLVLDYIREKGSDIKLNLGFYPYLAHEPMEQWGSVVKLKSIPAQP